MASQIYVPILKWRQGEYQALYRLPSHIKRHLVPLIEIPPIEWDFETSQQAKSIDEHLQRFGQRLSKKWGKDPILLDLRLIEAGERMGDGSHPLVYCVGRATELGSSIIPVTGIDRDDAYQMAVHNIASNHSNVCFRVSLEDWVNETTVKELKELLDRFDLAPQQADIVLDLGAPNFEPIDGFTNFLRAVYPPIATAMPWRNVIVAGTAFPKSMASLTELTQLVKRYEWLSYKQLVSGGKAVGRRPLFGDYAIAHPQLPREDMRLLRPAASIRYTIDDAWHVTKGDNVRDYGFGQYAKHCRALVKSEYFSGSNFSAADRYIEECGQGIASTGNLTTWRWVGTNHHLTKVTSDLATLAES